MTGGFGLTSQGKQIFIAQGTLVDDSGDDYLDGDLLFGLDYQRSVGWDATDGSVLPSVLNTSLGNLSFGSVDDYQYSGPRSGLALSAYPSQVLSAGNWSVPTAALSDQAFVSSTLPPVVIPDELGEVSEGLLFHAKRLNNSLPILDEAWMLAQGMTTSEADNINGPSCIRLPAWLSSAERAHPTAQYYLYFADHSGDYIRMAWAANIIGPWTGFQLDASLPIGDRGVLSLGSDDILSPGNEIVIDGHIASPQIFVDDLNQQFVMYYHGPATHDVTQDKGQSTMVATIG